MRPIEEIKTNKMLSCLEINIDGDEIFILGRIKFNRWVGSVIFDNAEGVEHVSISPFKNCIIPNWYELVETKRIFWGPEETVIQFIPKDSEYVNLKTNCMHLWKDLQNDHVAYKEIKA